MSAHKLFEIGQLKHNILVAASFESISEVRLVGVGMHGIGDEQEVKILSEFGLYKFFEFMSDAIFAHSDNDQNFAFLVVGVQGSNKFDKLMLVNFRADLNPDWVSDSPKELNLN